MKHIRKRTKVFTSVKRIKKEINERSYWGHVLNVGSGQAGPNVTGT